MVVPVSVLYLRFAPNPRKALGAGSSGAELGLLPTDKLKLLEEFCESTTPNWDIRKHGVFFDLTGTSMLYGPGLSGAVKVAQLAQRHIDIDAGGCAPSMLAAKLAAKLAIRAGGGILALQSGSTERFMAFHPVGVLGLASALVSRLERLGVRTLGDLQTVPNDLLRAVFGEEGWKLAQDASGHTPPDWSRERATNSRCRLYIGGKLGVPLVSRNVASAFRRSLALRAMLGCQSSPASCGQWFLQAEWPEGDWVRSNLKAPSLDSWDIWSQYLDDLWDRLPQRRRGLIKLELWLSPSSSTRDLQGNLFAGSDGGQRLAGVFRKATALSQGLLVAGSEGLLAPLGIKWYGPAMGLVDASSFGR